VWLQSFTPEVIDAARSSRHATGDRWFVDEPTSRSPAVGPTSIARLTSTGGGVALIDRNPDVGTIGVIPTSGQRRLGAGVADTLTATRDSLGAHDGVVRTCGRSQDLSERRLRKTCCRCVADGCDRQADIWRLLGPGSVAMVASTATVPPSALLAPNALVVAILAR
jgi:hypothetical protein